MIQKRALLRNKRGLYYSPYPRECQRVELLRHGKLTLISGVGEGVNIRGWRGYQYPGLARVSISGVGEGINIRG